MRDPAYDIFSGVPGDRNVAWIGWVTGLGAANDRMKQLAEKAPGPYFVFDAYTHKIVAQMDNSVMPKKAQQNREAAS